MIHARLEELIIGRSSVMEELRDAIRRAAPRSCPVLIQGPTGAGKELVAQGLHTESGRRGQFVPFNAAAIPESLFESELLGHVRGAFSGAIRDRPGLLRRAGYGTAFMDEVGELPLLAQAKLLRVVDTREVLPVGADVGQHVNFRLVVATNVDLNAAVQQGRFRADLLFRLRGIVITVPPLRDHREDVGLLASHFVRIIAADAGSPSMILTTAALRGLTEHDWPGNVRELRQTIEYSAFLADGPVISELHVARALGCNGHPVARAAPDLIEREKLVGLLTAHAGSVSKVALALGVDRSTAYRRMQRLGVSVNSICAVRRDTSIPEAASRTLSREGAWFSRDNVRKHKWRALINRL
ncbi:MAG: sigma 54-interacting transcriptional regulator [Gemmatimonadaceae bacterium]